MKKLLLLSLLILNFISCTGNSQNNIATDSQDEIDKNTDIKTLYKHGKYYSISKQPNKISDETDTALFIVASSKIKNFKAIEPYNKELKKYFTIDPIKVICPDTTGLTYEEKRKLVFPYNAHSSMELFYIGHYFLSKDSISKPNQYRYLLKHSILKDTTNIYALYDFAKEDIASGEFQAAENIIKRILEYDSKWKKPNQMLNYTREQMQRYNLRSLNMSFMEIINYGISYKAFDPNYKKF